MVGVFWNMCQRLPWERLLVTGAAVGVAASQPSESALVVVTKPGCAAADACVLVLGHLDGLSRGNGGSGVLAMDKPRMEEGAVAAEGMGQLQLATDMRAIASQLPSVRTKEDAAKLAQEFRPVADRAWRLGRICGLTRKRHGP